MSDRNPPHDSTSDYDPRANPNRGVRVHPMPRITHRRLKRFIRELDALCQSHQSTWRLAHREQADETTVRVNLMYWTAARKFLHIIEYLGTSNDPASHRGTPPGQPGRNPGIVDGRQHPPGGPEEGD